MSTILLLLTNIFFFLTNMLVKKKRSVTMFLVERRGGFLWSHMDSIYPFSGYRLCKLRKEDKRIEQTHQTIRKTSERKSRHV